MARTHSIGAGPRILKKKKTWGTAKKATAIGLSAFALGLGAKYALKKYGGAKPPPAKIATKPTEAKMWGVYHKGPEMHKFEIERRDMALTNQKIPRESRYNFLIDEKFAMTGKPATVKEAINCEAAYLASGKVVGFEESQKLAKSGALNKKIGEATENFKKWGFLNKAAPKKQVPLK